MDITDKTAEIPPIRLDRNSTFAFRCHKNVPCFTKCCRGISIILTPYDIILLKNRLKLPSDEFLAIYTTPRMLEKTDLPVVTLKLLDDEAQSCPFVRDQEGCIIYEDRPTACRYYPLGAASLSHKEGADKDDFYFFVHEPHCLGFEEKKMWTVDEWRMDQGVDVRDKINAEWTDLIVRKRSFPVNIKLTEKSKRLFFMVSYDMDQLKHFVFDSSFLKRFNVSEAVISDIKKDEIALLEFGLKWLKNVLFQDKALEAYTG